MDFLPQNENEFKSALKENYYFKKAYITGRCPFSAHGNRR